MCGRLGDRSGATPYPAGAARSPGWYPKGGTVCRHSGAGSFTTLVLGRGGAHGAPHAPEVAGIHRAARVRAFGWDRLGLVGTSRNKRDYFPVGRETESNTRLLREAALHTGGDDPPDAPRAATPVRRGAAGETEPRAGLRASRCRAAAWGVQVLAQEGPMAQPMGRRSSDAARRAPHASISKGCAP
jgi:hypothetical protein